MCFRNWHHASVSSNTGWPCLQEPTEPMAAHWMTDQGVFHCTFRVFHGPVRAPSRSWAAPAPVQARAPAAACPAQPPPPQTPGRAAARSGRPQSSAGLLSGCEHAAAPAPAAALSAPGVLRPLPPEVPKLAVPETLRLLPAAQRPDGPLRPVLLCWHLLREPSHL